MNMKLTEEERYAKEIFEILTETFSGENPQIKWDIDEIDATAWFTGLVKASTVIYNHLTDDNKNFFEWTQLSQSLILQSMMKEAEGRVNQNERD